MLSWLALLAAFIQSPQGASAAATTKHALRPRLHVAPNSLLARALIPKTSMPRKPAQLKSFARADWDVLSDLWHSAGLDDSPKGSLRYTAFKMAFRSLFDNALSHLETSPSTRVAAVVSLILLFSRNPRLNGSYKTQLKALDVSEGQLSPRFSPDRAEYLLEIPDSASSVTFLPKPKHRNAKVRIGDINQEEAVIKIAARDRAVTSTLTMKVVKVIVSSPNGGSQERIYTVRIKRELPTPIFSLDAAVFGRPKTFIRRPGLYIPQNSDSEKANTIREKEQMGDDAFFLLNRFENQGLSSFDLELEKDDFWSYYSGYLERASAIGIADGVGGWRDVGVDSGDYSKHFMFVTKEAMTLEEANSALTPVKAMRFAQATTKKPGTTTATVLSLNKTSMLLSAANLGDSGFLVLRNGKEIARSRPQTYEFNMPYQLGNQELEECCNSAEDADVYSVPVREGDVIVAATDGVFDNMSERKVAKLVTQSIDDGRDLQDVARALVDEAFKMSLRPNARTPWSRSMTKETLPRWKRALGYKVRGGKRDDITAVVAIVRGDYNF
mmetsp:Transcript_45898/g.73830  ORF Transcript_45898/g.73830 Transcript_45898/m.73830 type:complete len:554 (-) Transcript_45898:306-1967(-)